MPFVALPTRLSSRQLFLELKLLRLHLAAIVLVALVPTLAVEAAGAWLATGSYQQMVDNCSLDVARAAAPSARIETEAYVSTLATLPASPMPGDGIDGDLSAFYAHAARAVKAVGSSVDLLEVDLPIRSGLCRRFRGCAGSMGA